MHALSCDEFSNRDGCGRNRPNELGARTFAPEGGSILPQIENVFEVGNSRFIVDTCDSELLQELHRVAEESRELSKGEHRFLNRLLACTEQGRLRAWGWTQIIIRGHS